MEHPKATPEPEAVAAPGEGNARPPEPQQEPAGWGQPDREPTDDAPTAEDTPWVALLLGIALLLLLCAALMLLASSRAPVGAAP